MARLSIIIPTYNRTAILSDAINTVLSQSIDKYEVIIVDDCSDADVKSVVESYEDERLTYYQHESNQGAAAARNTGIKNAKGEYIAFLDDDDLWMENKLERQLNVFSCSDENVGVVYTGVQRFDQENNKIVNRTYSYDGDVNKKLLTGNFVGTFSCIMVKTDVINKAGLLDENFPRWQDWEWYIRLSEHCKFKSIPEPLVNQRNTTYNQISDNFEAILSSHEMLMNKYKEMAKSYNPTTYRKMKAECSYRVGQSSLGQGDFTRGRKLLLRSLINYPTTKAAVRLFGSLGGEKLYNIAKNLKNS